jgi:hypothetical protein
MIFETWMRMFCTFKICFRLQATAVLSAISETRDVDPQIERTLDLRKICNIRVKHYLSLRESRSPLLTLEDDIGTV